MSLNNEDAKWTPVGDSEPIVMEPVLVTVADSDDNPVRYGIGLYQGDHDFSWIVDGRLLDRSLRVTAWMYLPPLYSES